jgi:hypothetical protein
MPQEEILIWLSWATGTGNYQTLRARIESGLIPRRYGALSFLSL